MEPQKYPEVTVGALILNSKDEILLIKSHKWKDKFTIPGGHIEVGETIESALKREIKEEVNLDVVVVKPLTVQEAIFSKEFFKPRHFIFLDYFCKSESDNAKADDKEVQEVLWVSPDKSLELNLDSFSRKTIETYLKG